MILNPVAPQSIHESIQQFMNQCPENVQNISKGELESLFAFCTQELHTDSQTLIASLLLNATNKRFFNESVNEHIYLKNNEIPQIQLFSILIEKFPFVKYSQRITNRAIIETIGQATEATIIDIGIGQGAQMLNILELAKNLPTLKKLRIIGIEPFGEALRKAEENITGFASTVGFDVEFIGIHDFAENIDFSTFAGISSTIIINASLALHHIQSAQKRMDVIRKIKSIHPAAFLLIEPNVNHFETDFPRRFINCYHHYFNIFKVIDRIDVSHNDKNALKLFFGREIDDVIGKEESDRYEKHEKAERWIERLEQSGFTLNKTILRSPVASEAGVVIDYHPEGFVGFTNENETVLAVMCAN